MTQPEMPARPFWSVMIPTFNPSASYLEQALRGVLQAGIGPENMEIEVIDHASTTGEVEALVRRIAGDRVKVHREPVNKGLSYIMNRCIERASGEFIHILHHDDCVLPGFYSVLERLIHEHPVAGAAFCRYDFIDDKGVRLCEHAVLQTEAGLIEHPTETLAIRNQVQCPAIVVRRSAYETVGGFDGRFSFTLDWEMWVRIAASFPVLYHPKLLASFRVHSGSETSRLAKSGETVRESMRMIATYPKYIAAGQVKAVQAKAREWVCDLALQKAVAFIKNGNPACAMAQLHAGLGYDRRLSSWKRAFCLWARLVVKSRRWLIPPLPLFPAAWFQSKN